MKILDTFYLELVSIFGLCSELNAAQNNWQTHLKRAANVPPTTIDSIMYFGRSDPNNPNASYQYKRTLRDLCQNADKDGVNALLIRKMAVTFAYALWESKYRALIARESGKTTNEIASKIFADLNKYRQAVLHANSRLDRATEVFQFCKVGEPLNLSEQNFYELFKLIVAELNHLAKEYHSLETGYDLDNFLLGKK